MHYLFYFTTKFQFCEDHKHTVYLFSISVCYPNFYIKVFISKSFLSFQLFNGDKKLLVKLRASGSGLISCMSGRRKKIQYVKSIWLILHSDLKEHLLLHYIWHIQHIWNMWHKRSTYTQSLACCLQRSLDTSCSHKNFEYC